MRASAWRKRRRRAAFAVAAILLLSSGDFVLFSLAPHLGTSGNRGRNGLWLRSDWYLGRHSDAEIVRLGRRLEAEQIRYGYFHVRYIRADGRLRFHARGAALRLTHTLHATAPSVRPIAWIFAGNNGAGGLPRVPLRDPAVRRRMVREAVWLVTACGFSGVQWDYEVCRSGDPSFLQLLRETRSTFRALNAGTGRPIVSAATPAWLPRPANRWFGWSEAYFAEVAAGCDQLAVMAYDTAAFHPRLYAWLVAEQVRRVPRAARHGNPACGVLIGLPTYARGGMSHAPWSENLAVALIGVRSGLHGARPDPNLEGVSLYADWTTQPHEWKEYREAWLR